MSIQSVTRVLAAIALLGGALLATNRAEAAEALSLGSLFTNHAVLQREKPVPVWGRAEPGTKVVVQFAGQEQTAEAGKDGRWRVTLNPLATSAKGQNLVVKAGNETRTLEDLLVGEVWVCSGQSNMAFALRNSVLGEEAIAAAGDAPLRLFFGRAVATDEPQESIRGQWAVDSPQTAGGYSAVAYFFGKELRKNLGVPVGLIQSAVGGTVAEAWTARGDLESNPTLQPLLEQQVQAIQNYPQVLAAYKPREAAILARYEQNLAKAKAAGAKLPRKPTPPQDPTTSKNRPSGLYNGSIVPLQPYAIRGAIWYQGESNAARGKQYQTLFPAMIDCWRKAWGQGDFPFLFVQITPHVNMTPELREAQRLTLATVPHTAMAVTVDVGHPTDIHPKQKQPIGHRLALAARATVYGEEVEFSGPAYDAIHVHGNRATLSFKHLGGGLVAKGEELKGFAIAGQNGEFVPAKARIVGDTIVVTADAVPHPVRVRYGWSNVPEINLYNRAGLPASPFQTGEVLERKS